jgi:phosphate transport system substrate-binding protein
MRLAGLTAIAAVVLSLVAAPVRGQEVLGDNSMVSGAGSTFAFPVLSRWAAGYQRFIAGGSTVAVAGSGLEDPPTRPALAYEPSGSLAGMMRVKGAAVDFGATEFPLSSADLTKAGLAQFPFIIGGIAVVVNIDGVQAGKIKFTGPVLADIFLGTITSWSDPAIAALNPDLKLPDAKITVIHRSDGSGTTFNFTDYLGKVSPTWKTKVGADLLVTWPTGRGAKGNDGVAEAVKRTPFSIAYVEFARAAQARLTYAALRNKAGRDIVPSAKAFAAAAAGADWRGAGDFQLLLTDAAGDDSYPIVATAFALMRKNAPQARTRATLDFFTWSFEKGADEAARLGYVPLPAALVDQIKVSWSTSLLPRR